MNKKAALIGLLTLALVFLVAFQVSQPRRRLGGQSGSVSGSTTQAASYGPLATNPDLAVPVRETKVRAPVMDRTESTYQHVKRTPILDPETKTLMINCARRIEAGLTVQRLSEFQTLTEYLEKSIDLAHGHASQVLQYRNIHLLSASGARIRLSIQPLSNQSIATTIDSSDPARYEIHLIGQDDDGVYGSIPLPNELKGLSVEQTVAQFKSQGQVVADEVSETRSWGKKIAAHVIFKNAQVENLEVFTPTGSLVCARIAGEASAHCQCRN